MERRAIAIRGTVQGVGFRPFVFGLASQLELRGFVRNLTGSVQIEVEGDENSLDQFLTQIESKPPALAKIENIVWERRTPLGDPVFRIESSQIESGGAVVISPDVTVCKDCLAELFNPRDRRYRYPFLNCTNCGPRLTIINGSPYDRQRTTMAGFEMCPACRSEYEDPTNRRFHAQPTACAKCGPRLAAVDSKGQAVNVSDPLAWFIKAIRFGRIGAMKGLGGYHLVCDARCEQAVKQLRQRKGRDEKPFAVMVRDMAIAHSLCLVSSEQRLLDSPQRPIVLLEKRKDSLLAPSIAPGNPMLGIMLPYTPLHHLLMQDMEGTSLVMTSGNRSDEPIASSEPQAFKQMAGIADVFLTHDRPIHVRCDDSVTRIVRRRESPLRRSRGYAPQPISLPIDCKEPILATGGQLKATFALGRDRQAIVSHHMGDLDHFEAFCAFEKDVALYERLFQISPKWIAHDLHPDYASTRYANTREDVGLIPIQHHHAHAASCMAEHGLNEKVIAVTFDGTGYGIDATVWGGEFLVADFTGFHRAAHLRYVRMPGGDRAIKEPWRMALSHLLDAGTACESLEKRIAPVMRKAARRMIEQGFNSPWTSSAGRLFDAVAALAGIRDRTSYEGQAAIQLEWLAAQAQPDRSYPLEVSDEGVVDTRPLIRAVAEDVRKQIDPATIARRFHSSVVDLILFMCQRTRIHTGLNTVVLSGGVFMNALLSSEAAQRLEFDEFRVFQHQVVPPNDGGLSLGQLAIAAATQSGEIS